MIDHLTIQLFTGCALALSSVALVWHTVRSLRVRCRAGSRPGATTLRADEPAPLKGSLAGKRIIITGAAHGVGRALALRCAELGADLALCDRDVASLQEVVKLGAKKGQRLISISADVRCWTDMVGFAAMVRDELGGADILIDRAVPSLAADAFLPQLYHRRNACVVHVLDPQDLTKAMGTEHKEPLVRVLCMPHADGTAPEAAADAVLASVLMASHSGVWRLLEQFMKRRSRAADVPTTNYLPVAPRS